MARLASVLIVDSDPKGLDALAFGFEREGCRVTSTAAPAELENLARAEAPSAVVISFRGVTSDAEIAALRALRASEIGRTLPVIVLGAADARDRVIALGLSQDFLAMPVFCRDVVTAARLRASLGVVAAGAPEDEQGFSGALSELGLFFLTRTLIELRQSAVVTLERGNRRGDLRFCEGDLASASIGNVHGLPALHHMLLWDEAALDFKVRTIARRGRLGSPDDVIEGAERFLRDFAHAAQKLGAAQTVFEAVPETLNKDPDEVPSELIPILRLLDGRRTLAEVIEESPFRIFDTLRILTRMLETDTIRVANASALGTTSSSSTVFKPELEGWLRGPSENELIKPSATTSVTHALDGPATAAARPTGATGVSPARPSDGGAKKKVGKRGLDKSQPPAMRETTESYESPGATPQTPTASSGTAPLGQATRGELRATPRKKIPTLPPRRPSMMIDLPTEAPTEASAEAPAATPAASETLARATPVGADPAITRTAALARGLTPPPTPARGLTPPPVPRNLTPPPVSFVPAPTFTPHAAQNHPLSPTPPPAAARGFTPPPALAPHAFVRPPRATDLPTPLPAAPAILGAVPNAPSTKAARKPTGSIEIDPGLMAEVDAFEIKNTPPTPPPSPVSLAVKTPSPAGPRTPTTLPSPRLTPNPDVVSFVRTEPRKATPVPLPGAMPAAAAPTADSRPQRPSGEFNALEADFFAREADLYKKETLESFDDLDRTKK